MYISSFKSYDNTIGWLPGCRWGDCYSEMLRGLRASWDSNPQSLSLMSESHSVMSDSLGPHGLKPTRLLCPWISPGQRLEWVAVPFSRGSSQPKDQGSNPSLLHSRRIIYHLSHQGSLTTIYIYNLFLIFFNASSL